MELSFAQQSVQNIFSLLGANWNPETGHMRLSMSGAFTYTGSQKFAVSLQNKETKTQSTSIVIPSLRKGKLVEKNAIVDTIDLGIGITFMPNFGRRKIKFIVSLDAGHDLFDFRVYDLKDKYAPKLINEHTGIYWEQLAEVVEEKYDELIKTLLQGFIPL